MISAQELTNKLVEAIESQKAMWIKKGDKIHLPKENFTIKSTSTIVAKSNPIDL